jgi:hypothetical protein
MKILKRVSAVVLSVAVVASAYYYLQPTPIAHATAGPQIFTGSSTLYSNFSFPIALNVNTAAASIATSTSGIAMVAGTFSNLHAYLSNAPSPGTWTVALNVNGVNKALTCAMSGASLSCGDTTDTVAINAGDRVIMNFTSAGGVPISARSFTVQFTPTNAGDTMIPILSGSSATLEEYNGLIAGMNSATIETNAQSLIPEAGTIDQLAVSGATAPGSGTSRSFTLKQNAATSSLTCTIANTNKDCSDLSDSVSVAANDLLDLANTPITAPAVVTYGAGVRYRPTTAGDFAFVTNTSSSITAANSYLPLAGTASGVNANEASSTQPIDAMTMTGIAVHINNAPGAGKTRTFSLRVNNATSTCAVTISDTNTSGSASCTAAVNLGDGLDTVSSSSGTPASTGIVSVAYVGNANTGPTPPAPSYDSSAGWFEVL